MKKIDAVIEAGPLRLRAILMTTVSTMVGNLPVALALSEGGEIRQPMSVAVIGGLFTSTMLTLFVIPTVYLIFDDIKDWAAARIHRYRAYLRLRGMREKKPGWRPGSADTEPVGNVAMASASGGVAASETAASK
jgi:predicted RND superfamily exporter protein